MHIGLALVLTLLAPALAGDAVPREVELHKKGRRPRAPLRLDLQPVRQEADVVTHASMTVVAVIPMDIDLPASTFSLAATPTAGPVTLEVTGASVAEVEDDAMGLRESMLEGMEPWVGQSGSVEVTEHGLAGWSLAAESDVTLTESMDILVPTLPSEPVGRGARWSTTTMSDMDGQPLSRTLTWTMVERRGSVVILDLVGVDDLSAAAEDLQFSSTGSGRAEWDLRRPLPTASSWAQEMVVQGTTIAEGMEVPIDTRAEVELTLTSQ